MSWAYVSTGRSSVMRQARACSTPNGASHVCVIASQVSVRSLLAGCRVRTSCGTHHTCCINTETHRLCCEPQDVCTPGLASQAPHPKRLSICLESVEGATQRGE